MTYTLGTIDFEICPVNRAFVLSGDFADFDKRFIESVTGLAGMYEDAVKSSALMELIRAQPGYDELYKLAQIAESNDRMELEQQKIIDAMEVLYSGIV